MTRIPAFCVLIAFLLPTITTAGIRPSFDMDYSLWKATDIVVASEDAQIDGVLRVIENWKGKLQPGDHITIPELAKFSDVSQRTIHRFSKADAQPQTVSGARMVLFLVRDPAGEQKWQPAVYRGIGGTFDHSVAWIEDGMVYAIQQIINPGPSELIDTEMNEPQMHAAVAAYCVVQAALDSAVAARKPTQVMQAFEAFVRPPSYSSYGAKAALDALASMGADALPTLEQMVTNPTLLDWRAKAIDAIARIDSDKTSGILASALESERKYWESHGRGLSAKWWDADPDNARRELRNHFESLLATLKALKAHPSAAANDALLEIKQLWETEAGLAPLKEQVIAACDAAILADSNAR